jgi:hypothetical protein
MGRREGRAADEVLRCWAQAGLCVGRGASPVGEEVLTPPWKKEAPLGTPFSHQPQVPHPCIDPCISLSFLTTRYESHDQPT